MRVVLAGMMLAVAASGCLGGSDDAAGNVLGSGTDTSGALNATLDAPNRLPAANLTADALNGTAPLNVTFTLAFSDADQDGLTWSLTVGNSTVANGTRSASAGNATAGNATGNATGNASASASASQQVAHQFTEAGNYTVVLAVSDGTNSTSANVTVTVHPAGNATAAGGEGPVMEDDWVVFNADGTCDAKGEIAIGPEYVHERGDPPGTGYVAGGGTWFYEESNGIDGLQVGGSGPLGGEAAEYAACLNPDTLIF